MTTVLLHGLGTDRRQPLGIFEDVVQATAGPDELIVAPDVRAHGGFLAVGEPADFAIDRLAAEVCAQVPVAIAATGRSHHEASEPITIIGISMGAALALRIALLGLLSVRRVVFVRPAYDDRSLHGNLRPFPVIGQILAVALGGFSSRNVSTAAFSPAGGQALLAQFQAPDAARRAMRLVEIPRNRAFADDAELAELPARGIRSLVVGVPRDPVHPFSIAERWADGVRSNLELLPARDDGLATQTAELRDRVGRWLQRV